MSAASLRRNEVESIPSRVAASTAVKFAPDAAGRVAGNLPSGIVPEARLDALSVSKLAPEPENVVAVSIPVTVTPPDLVTSLLEP